MADQRISWDDYHRLIERLAARIGEDGWSFDAVVCVARGGLRVGDVLARVFRRPLGVVFTRSYQGEAGMTRGPLLISDHLSSAEPLPGPHWLLVDDLVDSGATLTQLVQVLQARYPEVRSIRTAVIWHKDGSGMEPDYCAERVSAKVWIHQPFDQYDQVMPGDLSALRWH